MHSKLRSKSRSQKLRSYGRMRGDSFRGGTYWIADSLKKTKKGAFSAKARHAGMSTKAYACKVVRSPSADVTTRREAQMFINMNRSRRC